MDEKVESWEELLACLNYPGKEETPKVNLEFMEEASETISYVVMQLKLNIDYESFVILQVVVSHSLYEINKSGNKTFAELEEQMAKITQKKSIKTSKLTFASIAEVLQLPRETVRRKVIALSKKDILTFSTYGGIKLGPSYKSIYKDFVSQTTLDLSSLVKKWEKTGALKTLLELDKSL